MINGLNQIEELILFEGRILASGPDVVKEVLSEAKSRGFSDERLAELLSTSLNDVQDKRQKHGMFQFISELIPVVASSNLRPHIYTPPMTYPLLLPKYVNRIHLIKTK